MSTQDIPTCVACEGSPAAGNSPCHVCGQAAQPEPEGPTVMEIIALADEIEEEGLGQIDLVRRALARWGRPAIQPVPVADPEAARQWPAHWSRAQREREAQSLCLQAGIDPVQQKRLCRYARDGMPLQDIHDLIAAEPDSRPSQEDLSDEP